MHHANWKRLHGNWKPKRARILVGIRAELRAAWSVGCRCRTHATKRISYEEARHERDPQARVSKVVEFAIAAELSRSTVVGPRHGRDGRHQPPWEVVRWSSSKHCATLRCKKHLLKGGRLRKFPMRPACRSVKCTREIDLHLVSANDAAMILKGLSLEPRARH
jgi:hypothetical protein